MLSQNTDSQSLPLQTEPELPFSDQKSLAHRYLSSGEYEKALPLYENILKTLEAPSTAQHKDPMGGIAGRAAVHIRT